MAENAALIVIDVQQGFDDPAFGRRSNPDCEANVAALITAWRANRRPLVFVRHDSLEERSSLAPGAPGNAFKAAVTGDPDLLDQQVGPLGVLRSAQSGRRGSRSVTSIRS